MSPLLFGSVSESFHIDEQIGLRKENSPGKGLKLIYPIKTRWMKGFNKSPLLIVTHLGPMLATHQTATGFYHDRRF